MAMIPRPLPGSPIKDLERLWLLTACAYEQFDETLMEDTEWDLMGKELMDRRSEWSPYFLHALPSSEYNPGTTGSGVDWLANTAARPYYEALCKQHGKDPLR